MSRAHVINRREFRYGEHTGLRIELSCPSGCVTGYLWGKDETAIREAASAIVTRHNVTLELAEVTVVNADPPGGHVAIEGLDSTLKDIR